MCQHSCDGLLSVPRLILLGVELLHQSFGLCFMTLDNAASCANRELGLAATIIEADCHSDDIVVFAALGFGLVKFRI